MLFFNKRFLCYIRRTVSISVVLLLDYTIARFTFDFIWRADKIVEKMEAMMNFFQKKKVDSSIVSKVTGGDGK